MGFAKPRLRRGGSCAVQEDEATLLHLHGDLSSSHFGAAWCQEQHHAVGCTDEEWGGLITTIAVSEATLPDGAAQPVAVLWQAAVWHSRCSSAA